MSLHDILHFILNGKKKILWTFQCATLFFTTVNKILQSCCVVHQNIPLISTRVLNKCMYFVCNCCSACVLCMCTNNRRLQSVGFFAFLHYHNCYYIFAFTCTLSCPVYHLCNEFLQKFKTFKPHNFSRHH